MSLPKLPNVEVRDTGTSRGRGVFALQDFCKDAVVEICPVIVFECRYTELPAELQEYVFDWSDLDTAARPDMQAIAMGYGGLYNCDNPANMRYESVRHGPRLLQKFIADRSIRSGEELTINYSGAQGAATSEDNRWFEGSGIVPILGAIASNAHAVERPEQPQFPGARSAPAYRAIVPGGSFRGRED